MIFYLYLTLVTAGSTSDQASPSENASADAHCEQTLRLVTERKNCSLQFKFKSHLPSLKIGNQYHFDLIAITFLSKVRGTLKHICS